MQGNVQRMLLCLNTAVRKPKRCVPPGSPRFSEKSNRNVRKISNLFTRNMV